MIFCLACAMALIFMVCGMLIYRLGVSDGVTLRKSSSAAGLFSKPEKNEVDDWQSIIAYDHKTVK